MRKLIEIVKGEYATFPEIDTYSYMTQDADGEVRQWNLPPAFGVGRKEWYNSTDISNGLKWRTLGYFEPADDRLTAILTPSDFAATADPVAPASGDRLYEIQKKVRELEGEITERIETIRELKAELAQHGFSMPFRRPRRR